jgi:hypothetical protein
LKTIQTAAVLALSALLVAPALAQPQPAPAPAAAQAAGKYSVDKTPIGVIWADPKGKEVLLKQLPPIEMYMDMIKDMTLVQVAPQSGGAIDDAKLKAIQADLDAIK